MSDNSMKSHGRDKGARESASGNDLFSMTDFRNEPASKTRCAARLGNPHARYELARRAVLNPSGEVDEERIFDKCRDAATDKVPQSLTLLGLLYLHGFGTFGNESEALRCFHRAAELGDAAAAYNLAICYERGIGTDRPDMRKAAKYLRSASGEKCERAIADQARLLHMFARSPKNRSFAAEALSRMANMGVRGAERRLAWCEKRAKQQAAGLPVERREAAVQFLL